MKIPLKIHKVSDDTECYEDTNKVIRYKISNENRHVVRNIDVVARTVKEDGEPTRSNFCKKITGIRTQILPNEDFEISCHIKLNKEFTETIEIDGKSVLSAIDIDIQVSGTLYIARR